MNFYVDFDKNMCYTFLIFNTIYIVIYQKFSAYEEKHCSRESQRHRG